VKGTRTTFNLSRFEDLPPEMIFAEVVLLGVQQFVGVMYGVVVRFYLAAGIHYQILEGMKEDLIETVTSLTIDGAFSDLLLSLCRLSTRQDELDLNLKFE